MSVDAWIDEALSKLPIEMLERSGKIFYSGRGAFSVPRSVYVLGLNPGGSPALQASDTIATSIQAFRSAGDHWSAYADEQWGDHTAGTYVMQPRVLHLLKKLNLDPRQTPSSNVVFARSANEADLAREKIPLLELCWPFHAAVIEALHVRAIICFGSTAASWVRQKTAATDLVGEWFESNARNWRATAFSNKDGLVVFGLTHPGRADWTHQNADPSDFVLKHLPA